MISLSVVCLAWAIAAARAQELPAAPAAAETTPGQVAAGEKAVRVREQQPSIYYAPDAAGNLRPIVNLPLERLQGLLEQRPADALDAQRGYVLDFKAEGEASQGRARLNIELTVRLNRPGWVRIPVRLDNCLIVPGSAAYEGPGEHLLMPDDAGPGYVCWLRGGGDQPHRVRLVAVTRIELVADESRLRLETPLATSTLVSVSVRGADLIGRVPEDAVLETTVNDDGPSTVFRVIASRGPVELTWWKRSIQEQSVPTLEATGAIFAQISGNIVEEAVTLGVRSLDQPFDRFRVRLPERAILKSGSGQNYAVLETATAGDSEAEPSGWIYEIQLDRPVRQTEVRLVSERSDIPEGAPIQLAGFELLEARRQSGHLAVAVTGDWQVLWGEDLNVHRVSESELPADLRGKPILAAFAYVAQPSSLQARIIKRQPRRVAESSLVFFVERDRERLDAQFKFSVTGARVSSLELNWPQAGWTIDEIGPPTLVDARQLNLDGRMPLTIPLLQPSQGELELFVRASRRHGEDARERELIGPTPVAELLRPSLLAVAAADNVRLVPRAESLHGLTRQAAVFLKNLPDLQQEPLCYRLELPEHRFAGDIEVLPRRVSVEGNVSAHYEQTGWLIEQRFTFAVQNEPLSFVSFALPRSVARTEQLTIQVDGQPVNPAQVTIAESGGGDASLRLDFSAPRIGRFVLSLAYPLPSSAEQTEYVLPLAVPLDATMKRTQAFVSAGDAVEIELAESTWRKSSVLPAGGIAPGALLVETREPSRQLAVSLRQVATVLSDPFVVERCWLQSRLTETQRYDRAVFRISTSRTKLELQLPPATALDTVQTWLDGQLITSRVRDPQRLTLSLPAAAGVNRHTVEVTYAVHSSLNRLSRPVLDPPAFLGGGSPRLTYWELLLPADRVLLLHPVDFNAEMDWVWNRFYWQRHPAMSQLELEMWSGGRREATTTGGANRYLFSMLGGASALSGVVIDQSSLVLASSGLVLAIGLLFLQTSVLRHPAVGLVLATVVLALALLRLDTALLVAQAAGIGSVLLVVAALLKWSLSLRRQSVLVVRRSPSSIVDRGSAREAPPLASTAGSHSSTKTTVPLEMASESKS